MPNTIKPSEVSSVLLQQLQNLILYCKIYIAEEVESLNGQMYDELKSWSPMCS